MLVDEGGAGGQGAPFRLFSSTVRTVLKALGFKTVKQFRLTNLETFILQEIKPRKAMQRWCVALDLNLVSLHYEEMALTTELARGICANWTQLISRCWQKVGPVQYCCTSPTFCAYRLISCVQLAQNRLPHSPPVLLYLTLWNHPSYHIHSIANKGGTVHSTKVLPRDE